MDLFLKFLILFFANICLLTARANGQYLIPDKTNWCGQGNVTKDCHHLGEDNETDACCREHDYCPYSYYGNIYHHGFRWFGLTTLRHCECDKMYE